MISESMGEHVGAIEPRRFGIADTAAASAQTGEAAHTPPVVLVDTRGFGKAFDAVITEVARSVRDPKVKAKLKRECSSAVRALLQGRTSTVPAVAADPHAVPPYLGVRKDGNPVAFFVRYFRLHVEAGAYYQSDLQRDNPPLFNALRHLVKHKESDRLLQEADEQLFGAGIQPVILGKRVRDITDLADLLPARRAIGPRTRDRQPVEAQGATALAREPALLVPAE